MVEQPHVDEEGNVLCWNGEVFGGVTVRRGENDTSVMASWLRRAAAVSPHAVRRVLQRVQGPWAMLYWHAGSGRLFFGRDPHGRRSLLIHLPNHVGDPFVLASAGLVWPGTDAVDDGSGTLDPSVVFPFDEVEPRGVYLLSSPANPPVEGAVTMWPTHPSSDAACAVVTTGCGASALGGMVLSRLPWQVTPIARPLPPAPGGGEDGAGFTSTTTATAVSADWASITRAVAVDLLRVLSAAVQVRVRDIPTHLHATPPASRCRAIPTHLLHPTRDDAGVTAHLHRLAAALHADSVDTVISALPSHAIAALSSATDSAADDRARMTLPGAGGGSASTPTTMDSLVPSPVAVLFSGGLDSMVLAALAHAHLPLAAGIDLINVCFATDHRSPDRITAAAGYNQLRHLYPHRRWQLIRVDETYATVHGNQATVAALLAPRVTHMDFNIGSALWYASRGVGYVEVMPGDGCHHAPGDDPHRVIGVDAPPRAHATWQYAPAEEGCAAAMPSSSHLAMLAEVHRGIAPADIQAALRGDDSGGDDAGAATGTWLASDVGGSMDEVAMWAEESCPLLRLSPPCAAALTRCASWPYPSPPSTTTIKHDGATVLARGSTMEGKGKSQLSGRQEEGGGDKATSKPTASGTPTTRARSNPVHARGGDKKPSTIGVTCPVEVRLGLRCGAPVDRRCVNGMCATCCGAHTPIPATTDEGATVALPCCRYHAAVAAHAPTSNPSRPTTATSAGDGVDDGPSTRPDSGRWWGGDATHHPHHGQRVLIRSGARVLLIGIGSDEQMVGYARHRSKFRFGGWPQLGMEVDKDVARLWRRNLGRDDRICSDHGREVRSPYLAEPVMAFLAAMPLPAVANVTLPAGVGDKLALRVVASMLGLTSCATAAKRAIHFGSRIAKQSNVHSFGSNAAAKGEATFHFKLTGTGGPSGGGDGDDSDGD